MILSAQSKNEQSPPRGISDPAPNLPAATIPPSAGLAGKGVAAAGLPVPSDFFPSVGHAPAHSPIVGGDGGGSTEQPWWVLPYDGITKPRLLIHDETPPEDWNGVPGVERDFVRDFLPLIDEAVERRRKENAGKSREQVAFEQKALNFEQKTLNEKAICNRLGLDVLGQTEKLGGAKVFSAFTRRTHTIDDCSRLKRVQILTMCGPEACFYVVETAPDDPTKKKKDEVKRADKDAETDDEEKESEEERKLPVIHYATVQDVRDAIALLASVSFVGDDVELGPGVWPGRNGAGRRDETVILVGAQGGSQWDGESLHRINTPRHRGNVLEFSGGRERSWYDHAKLDEHLQQCNESQWRIATFKELAGVFSRWHWRDEDTPDILAGLVLATWIQTLWDWRPMVAVTGATNAGKSVLAICLEHIFGQLAIRSSDSTAAGIRQAVGKSSPVILCDEFDAESQSQRRQQAEIQKMLRAGSRGDRSLRGTTDQSGKTFVLRQICWVLGIQLSGTSAADRNRYLQLELTIPAGGHTGKHDLPSAAELADLGQRTLAVAVHCANTATRIAAELKSTRSTDVHSRVIESLCVPVAMMAAVKGSDAESARAILDHVLRQVAATGDAQPPSDEEKLVRDILGSRIRARDASGPDFQMDEHSVGRLLMDHTERAKKLLDDCGIRIDYTGHSKGIPNHLHDKKCILFECDAILRHVLRGTGWELGDKNISQILKRIPDACSPQVKIAGARNRPIAIPYEWMEERFLSEPTDDSERSGLSSGQDEF